MTVRVAYRDRGIILPDGGCHFDDPYVTHVIMVPMSDKVPLTNVAIRPVSETVLLSSDIEKVGTDHVILLLMVAVTLLTHIWVSYHQWILAIRGGLKMKEYITNKNMLIGILLVLLGISIADIFMRIIVFKEVATFIPNFGDAFVTMILSLLLIIFALTGKDRAFYIACGGWLAYFVLNQLFALPGLVTDLIYTIDQSSAFGILGHIIHILSVITIIGIGGLVAEYLNDGTIYNKAFNILCVSAFVMLVILIILSISSIATYGHDFPLIAIFYDLTRVAMLFLFTYFAYDSAKTQLNKTQL